MSVRVETQDENGIGTKKPMVFVYEDDKLVCTIIASIEPKQGADGGHYRCITFIKVD